MNWKDKVIILLILKIHIVFKQEQFGVQADIPI